MQSHYLCHLDGCNHFLVICIKNDIQSCVLLSCILHHKPLNTPFIVSPLAVTVTPKHRKCALILFGAALLTGYKEMQSYAPNYSVPAGNSPLFLEYSEDSGKFL